MNRLSKIHTKHVWANPRACAACWKCIASCPGQVIGKVGFLWHKHIIFANPDSCTGCRKCIQTCPQGVFSEDIPDVLRAILAKRGIKF
jgi:2-oxoglutarate ferredoxin oxidoreductase subunit delta